MVHTHQDVIIDIVILHNLISKQQRSDRQFAKWNCHIINVSCVVSDHTPRGVDYKSLLAIVTARLKDILPAPHSEAKTHLVPCLKWRRLGTRARRARQGSTGGRGISPGNTYRRNNDEFDRAKHGRVLRRPGEWGRAIVLTQSISAPCIMYTFVARCHRLGQRGGQPSGYLANQIKRFTVFQQWTFCQPVGRISTLIIALFVFI